MFTIPPETPCIFPRPQTAVEIQLRFPLFLHAAGHSLQLAGEQDANVRAKARNIFPLGNSVIR